MSQWKRQRMDLQATADKTSEPKLTIVNSFTGENMLTFPLTTSLSRDVWKKTQEQLKLQPGRRFMILHNGSMLHLNTDLSDHDIYKEIGTISCTLLPTDLNAVQRFLQKQNVSDEEFSLQGITQLHCQDFFGPFPTSIQSLKLEMSCIDIACMDILKLPHQLKTLMLDFQHRQIQSKHFFPEELKTLTLKTSVPFNTLSLPTKIKNLTLWGPRQTLGDIHLPTNLENLSFGWDFSEHLDELSLPNGLKSLSFEITFQSHLYKQHLFSNTIMSSSYKLNGSNLPPRGFLKRERGTRLDEDASFFMLLKSWWINLQPSCCHLKQYHFCWFLPKHDLKSRCIFSQTILVPSWAAYSALG